MLTPENTELPREFSSSRDKCLTLIQDILTDYGVKKDYGRRFASIYFNFKPNENLQNSTIVRIMSNRIEIVKLRRRGKIDSLNYEDYDFLEDGRVKLTIRKEKEDNTKNKRDRSRVLNKDNKEIFLENPKTLETLHRRLEYYKTIFQSRKVRQNHANTKSEVKE